MSLELCGHEVLSHLSSIAQALQAAVHIASIPKVFEADPAPESSKGLFLQVEVFEHSGLLLVMSYFELALLFMVFVVCLGTVVVAVLD